MTSLRTLVAKTTSSPNSPSEDPDKAPQRITDIQSLTRHQHSDPSFSDFKIICAGKEYNVHRVILASHSGYFKRLFVSVFKEAEEQKVELHGDPEGGVAAMIEYFYSFNYNAFNIQKSYKEKEKPVLFHIHSSVFTIADKYDIPGLKDLALSNFVKLMDSYIAAKSWEPMARRMIKTVPRIYQNTPPTDPRLRKLIVKCFANKNCLLDACYKAAFDATVQEVPEFASDLVRAMGKVNMIEDQSTSKVNATGD